MANFDTFLLELFIKHKPLFSEDWVELFKYRIEVFGLGFLTSIFFLCILLVTLY